MTERNFANRTVWTGDCLYVLRGMNSETVDLIYLDPPFNSNANYAAPIGSQAAGAAFKDTWTLSDVDAEWVNLIEAKHPALHRVLLAAMTNSDKAYLVYMAARLLEMRRILKPTGSIYLHCDPTMSHYLKLVMDAIFGRANFQGHVTWRRTFAHNDRMFGATSDHLLWYSKTADCVRNIEAARVAFSDDEVVKRYPHVDERGRYIRDNLMGPKTSGGESGQAWKGCDPTLYGRCWSAPRTGRYARYIHDHLLPGYLSIEGVHKRLDALDDAGLIHWTSGGVPLLKRYAVPGQGLVPGDTWVDIPPLSRKTTERVGYPTQKPLALLERIIRASSNEGDLVLDPFAGCATACVAADTLGRRWAGIDISPKAVELVNMRLQGTMGSLFHNRYVTDRTDLPLRTDLGALPPYRSHARTLYGLHEGNCGGCGQHFEARHLEVDHIISRAKGGTDHIDNLQLLCGSCNRIKGDRGMEYLRVKLAL